MFAEVCFELIAVKARVTRWSAAHPHSQGLLWPLLSAGAVCELTGTEWKTSFHASLIPLQREQAVLYSALTRAHWVIPSSQVLFY